MAFLVLNNPDAGLTTSSKSVSGLFFQGEELQYYSLLNILKFSLERCRSGRSGRSRKPLYKQLYPGFESLSLRHYKQEKAQKVPFGIVFGFFFMGGINLTPPATHLVY